MFGQGARLDMFATIYLHQKSVETQGNNLLTKMRFLL